MKKLIAALATAALILPVAAQAQERYPDSRYGAEYRNERGEKPPATRQATSEQRVQAKRWKQGDRFDHRQATNYRVVDHRKYRKLAAPPRGYRWVRSGHDAVLVGTATGRVRHVVPGVFG